MLGFHQAGKISLEKIVEKMCHAPAVCFQIDKRGFLDEGYWADIAIVDPNHQWTVSTENLYYKCGWSPFEGQAFAGKVEATIVSGHLAYRDGQFFEDKLGERLAFDR
jgi:dihydroorotase